MDKVSRWIHLPDTSARTQQVDLGECLESELPSVGDGCPVRLVAFVEDGRGFTLFLAGMRILGDEVFGFLAQLQVCKHHGAACEKQLLGKRVVDTCVCSVSTCQRSHGLVST